MIATTSTDSNSAERMATLRTRLQTAFLIGGWRHEEIEAHLAELLQLESTLSKVGPESLHAKPAAA